MKEGRAISADEGRLRFEHEAIHSAAELFDAGKAARGKLPRSGHAEYKPAKNRDPIGILRTQQEHRVPELIPLRLERMTASPFAFYRGSAAVQVADLRDALIVADFKQRGLGWGHLERDEVHRQS